MSRNSSSPGIRLIHASIQVLQRYAIAPAGELGINWKRHTSECVYCKKTLRKVSLEFLENICQHLVNNGEFNSLHSRYRGTAGNFRRVNISSRILSVDSLSSLDNIIPFNFLVILSIAKELVHYSDEEERRVS